MSLIVEPSTPYSSTQLQLDDSKRWSRLFPLLRPSTRAIETPNGEMAVVDTALANSKNVLLVAVGKAGHFSSKILSESHLAAFAIEQTCTKALSADDLVNVLRESSFPVENGVVVVRIREKEDLVLTKEVVELSVAGPLRFDHILSLLSAINPEIKASFNKTYALCSHFVTSSRTTTTEFSEIKTEGSISVIHGTDTVEFTSAKSAVAKDLDKLLKSEDLMRSHVVYSIHYSDINGLSRLENNILAHGISEYCNTKNMKSHISHSTIIEDHSGARGWAISLCVVPTLVLTPQAKPSNALAESSRASNAIPPRQGQSKIQFSDSQVRQMIIAGCERVIKEEPTITEYDTIVGDGDCGYTLRDGAKQVTSFIKTADLATLPSTLSALVDDLEVNMGGTSGALYCIFLSSLAQHLWDAETFPDALQGALDSLLKYTSARLGDRTCLDCLIPFIETLRKTGYAEAALAEASKGVESTKKLEAKLGRSSYLDESTTRGVPDPGAYGLLLLLEGMILAK